MGSPAADKKKVHEMTVTTLRVEREKLDAFGRVAERQHRTIAQQFRHLIDKAIEDEPEEIGA